MRTSAAVTWGFAIITVNCKLWHRNTHKFLFFSFFLEIEQGKSPLFSNTSLADGDGAEHLPHPAGGDAIGKFLPHAWLRKAARSRGGGESPAGMPRGAPAPPMAPSWTAFHFSCSGPEFFFLSFLLKSKLLSFSPCLHAQPSHRHPALSFSLFSSWDFALLHGRDWIYPPFLRITSFSTGRVFSMQWAGES